MKKMILTSLAMIGLLSVQAQEKEKENDPDTTRLNLGTTEVLIIKTTKGTVVVDGKTVVVKDSTGNEEGDKKKRYSHDGHWAGVDFGVGIMMNSQFKSSFPTAPQWENDPAKSFYWNLNIVDHRFNLYKEYIGITTGLGLNFTRVGLSNNYVLNQNADSVWAVKDSIPYSKNKLRATYLQIPLLLEFNTNSDEDKSFYFATGVIGGVRIGSSVKRKRDISGFESKEKIKGVYGLSPFKLDATVRMGYADWGLFANYSLVPLFDKKKTAEVYPLTFGLSYNF